MPSAMFSTPRPEPNHLLPALAGSAVVLLALPIFLVAGWPLAGWGLAAVLWVAVHVIDVVLHRTRGDTGNLAASGVQAFGLFFKSLGLLVVLVAAVAADPALAIAAALTYALAYTFELGLSLVSYFGAAR
jgi:hypothetical protein